MTAKAPPPDPLPPVDVAATLAALQQACDDPALPAATRPVLQQAHDALLAASAASEAERNRYRALFDAVPDPVSVLAWDGTVLDLNKAGMAAYKRPREQIIGQPIHVLNPDLPRDHLGPVRDTLSGGGHEDTAIYRGPRSGYSVTVVTDSAGRAIGFTSVVRRLNCHFCKCRPS